MNKLTSSHYDSDHDILYIVIQAGVEDHFVEVSKDIVIEFDQHKQPIGLEILNAAEVMVSLIGHERLAIATV